jgi:hypothetical protein
MKYAPKNLVRLTEPEGGLGASWPQYFYVGIGQGRNPDALERANFASTLRAVGGETETVKVVNDAGAFGWGELIAIHESDAKALEIADEIKAGLAESSIVDHDTYYECQQEDAELTWKNCFDPLDRINYIREFRDQFKFHDLADMIGCVRGKYFSGYASELLELTG